MPAVTVISTLPAFASPEEHRAFVGSTPASFSDIPPVLKHQEPNVSVRLDPPVDGFTDPDTLQGTLYILTSVLVFMSNSGHGFQIEYPAITLHAISRGANGPSIYCQLDESTPLVEGATTAPVAVVDEDEDTPLRELTILPQSSDSLEPIFDSLSQCAALHPDRNALSEDEGDYTNGLGGDEAVIDTAGPGSVYDTFTGDEAQELSEAGRAALDYLESIIYDPIDLPTPTELNGVNAFQEEELHQAVQAAALDLAAEEHADPTRALAEGTRPLQNL